MADLGDKVGDVYIEVHAEISKGDLAKAQKQLEASTLKAEQKLNEKRTRNFKESIQKANLNAIDLERKRIQEMGRLQAQALSEDKRRTAIQKQNIDSVGKAQLAAFREDQKRNAQRQADIDAMGKAQMAAAAEDARRNAAMRKDAHEMGRLQAQAYSEDQKRTAAKRKAIDDLAKLQLEAMREDERRFYKNGKKRLDFEKRYKDGGRPGAGEVVENLISILPGQLEKVFRDPRIATAATVAGVTLGTFLLSAAGGAIGAAGGAAALFGGAGLAISASPELKAQGVAMGNNLLSGLQQAALNRLGPVLQESFDYLSGSNFEANIKGTFDRIFTNVSGSLIPFVANTNGALMKILDGFENLSEGSAPFLKELGGGINRIGGAFGELLTKIGRNPELADALNDVFDVTVNLVNGFGDLVVKAGEFWQVLKDIKNLDLGDAFKGLQDMGHKEARSNKDPWWKDFLSGDWGGGGDEAYDKIMARREALNKTTEAGKAAEHQNYNTQRSLALANAAVVDSTGQTRNQSLALEAAEKASKDYADALDYALDTNKRYSDSVYDSQMAAIDWAEGMANLKDQFKGANDSISLNTQRGTENRKVLVGQVKAARDQAQAILDAGGSAKDADKKYKELTDKILSATGATGKNRDAIKGIISSYKEFQALPVEPKKIVVRLDPTSLDGVRNTLAQLTKSEVKTIFTIAGKKGIPLSEAASNYRKNSATGGRVSGPGTGTSDSVPMNLSNGEFVIKASSARAIGLSNLNAMNSSGKMPGNMATGGKVGNGRGSSGTEKRAYEALLKQIATLTKTITAQSKALEAYNNQLSASRDQFKSFVNLSALDTEGKSTGDLIGQLQGRKAAAGGFASRLKSLQNRGLSATALQQVSEAGPDSPLAKMLLSASAYDIKLINGLLGGSGAYAGSIAGTIHPSGPGLSKKLAANQKKLVAKKKSAAKLKPVKAKGATISYAGGKTTALFSSKEMQQQQLQAGTYVTVVIDGKEVRAIVKEEQKKTSTKSNRNIKSGRK